MIHPAAAELDHLILPVTDPATSIGFYGDALGFVHEGRAGPFEVLRVNPGLTLDLLQQTPVARLHLAFRLSADNFTAARRRLERLGIAYGGAPFDHASRTSGHAQGATGMLEAVYFADPDGHNIEIRAATRAPAGSSSPE